jgi:SAM-dependent methyltransferase
VADASVDLVVSNCVLNLVRDADKRGLIAEMFRVLRVGGRVALSDIVSDERVPERLKADPELWSGCVSGAFHELELLRELEAAGFHGIAGPWKPVEDDDGHVLERGVRTAVCAKTFRILTSAPYAGQTIGVEPRVPVPEDERAGFDCRRTTPRSPRETKGLAYRESRGPCDGGSCC